VRIARDIGPSGVIAQIATMPDEGWELIKLMSSERDLSDLAIGICLSIHGRAAYAIAADALLLDPVAPERVAEMVEELAPRSGDSAPAVLVLESDPGRRHAYEAALTSRKFMPRVADSAADVLDLAIAEQPVAVVVNLMLASFTGFEAVRRLQRERRTRHLPVIVLASDGGGRTAFRDATPQEDPSYDDLALTLHELLRRQSARAVRLAARSVELEHVASS
jgi:CheY-like chemotaxis protein